VAVKITVGIAARLTTV